MSTFINAQEITFDKDMKLAVLSKDLRDGLYHCTISYRINDKFTVEKRYVEIVDMQVVMIQFDERDLKADDQSMNYEYIGGEVKRRVFDRTTYYSQVRVKTKPTSRTVIFDMTIQQKDIQDNMMGFR